MVRRLAIALGVVALLVVTTLALVPMTADGYDCGSIASPRNTFSQAEKTSNGASDMYDRATTDFGRQLALSVSERALRAALACNEARKSRRVVLYVLASAGVALPLLIVFVAGGFVRRSASRSV